MTDKQLFLKYNMVPTGWCKKTPELIRAIKQGEISWREPPIHKSVLLLLHANYTCNCQCIYCEHQHLREEYRNAIMPEAMVREVVDKLGPILRNVTWHGGEPLLLPETTIAALEDEKQKMGFSFETMLQTNGINLSMDKLAFLDSLGIIIGTSFDGLHNDASRGVKSTEAMLRLLRDVPERMHFISVNYTDTIESLIENYEYLKSIGCRHFQNCVVRENIIENDNKYIVKNDVAVPAVLKYIEYWMHDTNDPIPDSYVVRQIERVLGTTFLCEDSYCIGGWLIIDPFGNIGLCGHSQQNGGIVNIRDIRSYQDLITHPKYLSILNKQQKLVKTCSDCEWYRVCYGACMGTNYEYDHSYNTINPRNCEYIKEVLSGILDLVLDIDMNHPEKYNPIFLKTLRDCCYFSLSEIKAIEEGS